LVKGYDIAVSQMTICCKDIQCNDQQKKINDGWQNITQKTSDWTTLSWLTQQETEGR
jgi:hypothetical protein